MRGNYCAVSSCRVHARQLAGLRLSSDVYSALLAGTDVESCLEGWAKDIGSQTGVSRRQRLCQLCGADYGDEMHLVFECHGLTDLRVCKHFPGAPDYAAVHVAASYVAGCPIFRCKREEDAGT